MILEALGRGALLQSYYEQGFNGNLLAQKHLEELNATETKTFFDKRTGEVVYSEPLIAWDIRQNARESAHKILDHLAPEKHQFVGDLPLMTVVVQQRMKQQNGKKNNNVPRPGKRSRATKPAN